MCAKCADSLDKYYPKLSIAEKNELLFAATCFPLGDHEDIERQLKELIQNTDGTLSGALDYANKLLEEGMKQ